MEIVFHIFLIVDVTLRAMWLRKRFFTHRTFLIVSDKNWVYSFAYIQTACPTCIFILLMCDHGNIHVIIG